MIFWENQFQNLASYDWGLSPNVNSKCQEHRVPSNDSFSWPWVFFYILVAIVEQGSAKLRSLLPLSVSGSTRWMLGQLFQPTVSSGSSYVIDSVPQPAVGIKSNPWP